MTAAYRLPNRDLRCRATRSAPLRLESNPMAWNPRLLRLAPASSPNGSSTDREDMSAEGRAHLLAVFRRLAAILQLTVQMAWRAGKSEQHASFEARLAIFRARVEAGDASARLAIELGDYGRDFEAFITEELGCRRL